MRIKLCQLTLYLKQKYIPWLIYACKCDTSVCLSIFDKCKFRVKFIVSLVIHPVQSHWIIFLFFLRNLNYLFWDKCKCISACVRKFGYITNYYKRKIYIYTHTSKFDIHKVYRLHIELNSENGWFVWQASWNLLGC